MPKDYLTHNLIGHFHFMLGVNVRDHRLAPRRAIVRAAERRLPTTTCSFTTSV